MGIPLTMIETLLQQKKIGNGIADPVGFSVDSRTIRTGECFVAIEGAREDGHAHIASAIAKGACGIMLHRERYAQSIIPPSCWAIVVDDSRKALFFLAKAWRKELRGTVIAITGSVGKTTTKDYIGRIIAETGIPFTITKESQNSMIGVPMTVLSASPSDQIIISEVGIQKPGEMEHLAALLLPDITIITTIGIGQHLLYFGTRAALVKEKCILAAYTKRTVLVHGDSLLPEMLASISAPQLFSFGENPRNHIRCIDTSDTSEMRVALFANTYSFSLQSPHQGNRSNALGAIATAYVVGVPLPVIQKAIAACTPSSERFCLWREKQTGALFIDDAFNASFDSVIQSIISVKKLNKGSIGVIIGDMKELGNESLMLHELVKECLEYYLGTLIKEIVIVGESLRQVFTEKGSIFTPTFLATWQEAVPFAIWFLQRNEVVLVKSAQGVGLRNILPALRREKQFFFEKECSQ